MGIAEIRAIKAKAAGKVKTDRINPRTKKLAKANREYTKLNKAFLAANPWCTACDKIKTVDPTINCGGRATEIHHKAGRLGELLTDTAGFLGTCSAGHAWIEAHPRESKKLKLSQTRLTKPKK